MALDSALLGGFSVCTLIRRWSDVQDTSFFYLEKSVPGMKEGKTVTGSRDSQGGTSVRRGKWWDQWPEGNSAVTKGWSLFLSFEISPLFLFSLPRTLTLFFFFSQPILWFIYFILSSLLRFWSPCSSVLFLNISYMKTRGRFNDGGIDVFLRWERFFFYSRKNPETAERTKKK